MKERQLIMGMPVTIDMTVAEPAKEKPAGAAAGKAFDYFSYIDHKFSTYKPESEISRINRGELAESEWSEDMKEIMELSKKTKEETDGYFDIANRDGKLDPSGIVKGWAIRNAARILREEGFTDFIVDAGGDMHISGVNDKGRPWSIGIKNPFNQKEIVKRLSLTDSGIATSGTYIRGQHIYNPKDKTVNIDDIVSLTVISSDIYDADRFATAAFAMGSAGITFIENMPGLEGYMIDSKGIATMTSGFDRFVEK